MSGTWRSRLHGYWSPYTQAAVWQEVLLASIGEQFLQMMEEGTDVCRCTPPLPSHVLLSSPLFLHSPTLGDDVCGVSVRIRGFDQNVIQIWNMDSELHSKSSVSAPKQRSSKGSDDVCMWLQVIQKVKELIPSIEINEFYQCES